MFDPPSWLHGFLPLLMVSRRADDQGVMVVVKRFIFQITVWVTIAFLGGIFATLFSVHDNKAAIERLTQSQTRLNETVTKDHDVVRSNQEAIKANQIAISRLSEIKR